MVGDTKQKSTLRSSMERFPAHVKAIGMISIEMANLDVALADLLGVLLNRNKKIAHAIFFTPRAGILRIQIVANVGEILRVTHSDVGTTVAKFCKRAKNATEKRHNFIHNRWGASYETDAPGHTPLPDHNSKWEPVDIKVLKQVISDIRELIIEIYASLTPIHDTVWKTSSSKDKSS